MTIFAYDLKDPLPRRSVFSRRLSFGGAGL